MAMRFRKFLVIVCTLGCLTLIADERVQQKSSSDLLGIYFGGFGGWIFPYSLNASQRGTAFFPDFAGGPLHVNAKGRVHSGTTGFGGLHVGYEWMKKITPDFRLAPAIEVEGYYFANTNKGDLDNPTTRVDAHEFIDTFPMRIGALLVNGILEFNNDYISPYIGVGIGAGMISIHGANSAQIDPIEPGINHFNSDTSDFAATFSTQAKAGLRYRFLKHYRLFGEYRFIYFTSSDFTFGSTRYPTHVPTSKWSVALDGMCFNGASLGIDFLF